MQNREKIFSVTIKDCRVDTFTVGGHGGSGKDTSNTGVRIVHDASGAIGTSTETRSQLKNKQTAFRRMAESLKFKQWVNNRVQEIMQGKSIEQMVEDWVTPENLVIEVRDSEGNWVAEAN